MRIPVATYRLQINDDFTLHDALHIVPWLAHLGISDLYLSPIFEARSGSTHGYDITDPTRIRESIGGRSALVALADETRRHHMGLLVDVVPNHMAASVENPWWRDVLLHGQASRYAAFFDIEWDDGAASPRLRLPVLAESIDVLIDRGEISVDAAAGEIICQQLRLPLAEGSHTGDVRGTLERQHYQLVPWKRASEEVFYRRFFDISDLAALRVEDDDVFDATHALLRELVADGTISGIRIDHIDGLRDPTAYLHRLRERLRGPDGGPVYTVVEKILAAREKLPQEWECEGTTGYEFLNLATGLLVAPEGHAAIDAFHRRVTGDTRDFGELVREKKLLVMDTLFGGELSSLGRSLAELTGLDPASARTAVAALTASMQVYRTYIRDRHVRAEDRHRIQAAAADAHRRADTNQLRSAIDMVRRTALLEDAAGAAADRLEWVMHWQQFSGPVMAKGFEDTALYCHNAFLAANDVGSDPSRPCLTREELYAELQQRSVTAPLSLNATATHDTKRGEDTRARIAVLSELPDEWRTRLRHWIRTGDEWKADLAEDEDTPTPSADIESLLYQTLLGAWPLDGADSPFRERIKAYMTKAVREAKEQTSWRRPDEDYEQALHAFIERLMAGFGREGVADNVGAFAHRLAPLGALNSLAQMLFKTTAPGIPDFYQGTDLWSFTLVDPDNRGTVDFAVRRRLFDDIAHLRDTPDGAAARDLLASWEDGRIKQLLTALALRFRATHREVFEQGQVIELHAEGPAARHVLAFARGLNDRACITMLPRWTASLGGSTVIEADRWADTTIALPPPLRHAWHDALTNATIPAADVLHVGEVFRALPFALLELSQPIGA